MYCSENSRWNLCPPLEDETLEAEAGQLSSLGLGDAFRDVTCLESAMTCWGVRICNIISCQHGLI